MPITVPARIRSLLPAESGDVMLALESDLLPSGRYGANWLIATRDRVLRVELDGVGDRVAADWRLEDLNDFAYEELVDAGCLVARSGGRAIELLRGTTVHAAQIAVTAKRLNRLVREGDVESSIEVRRECPRCKRPLPKDSEICEGCLNRGKTLRRLVGFLAPYKLQVGLSIALVVADRMAALIWPYLIGVLTDRVLQPKSNLGLFAVLIGALIGTRLLQTGLQVSRLWLNAWLGNKVTVDVRRKLFEHLQALSLSFYDKRTIGSVMSRVTNDTGALYEVLVDGIPMVLTQGLLLIGIPIALLIINWEVAIWTLMPVPFILYLVRKFRKRIERVWRRFWHSWSRVSGALTGVLSGMRVVKAFKGEQREVARFGKRIQDLADTGYAAETSWATFFPAITLLVSVGTILVWYAGGSAVLNDRMTLGQLMAFSIYLGMLEGPLQVLTRLIDWMSRGLTAAERVFEVIDTVPDIQQPSEPITRDSYEGRIALENVHFGYDKAHEVLHGIDLVVEPGEMIGIVGASGSGKTTTINLILRFYDPTEGRVTVDGIDLRDVDLAQFRSRVGIVPQESFLFPGSVKDNIAYGRPDASLEEVIAAARAANAHDFITKFADGYDSYVGERGQRLSGGERQRIAIARAILHNPKILILDEATSSVDTETERMIQEALHNLVQGRTTIAIAHRLSTLRHANRILVFEDGRIAETGSHDELMELKGRYFHLVSLQQEIARVRATFVGDDEDEEG
jgi:ATP-binding cassette subfamily B protein